MHTKMKVTFAGSNTLLGCTFTLGSPMLVGVMVGVGKASRISVLVGVMVGVGSFTTGDEELCVGIVTDLVSGRILATLLVQCHNNNYNNTPGVH